MLGVVMGVLVGLMSNVAVAVDTTQVRVFKVLEGDRVLARSRYHSQRYRLYGIDAPAPDAPGGELSMALLTKMVGGQRVQITPVAEREGAEPVIRMRLRDYDISLEMIRAGGARALADAPASYQAAESQARAQARGMWKAQEPTQ